MRQTEPESLIDRIRTSLLPRIEPELRATRTSLARSVILVQFAVLAFWGIALLVLSSLKSDLRVAPDLAAIAALAVSGAAALSLAKRGSVRAAGYLISFSTFAVIAVGTFLIPRYFPLVAVAFLLPVLISGAVIGGWAPFLFAFSAIVINTTAVITAAGRGVAVVAENETWTLIYLVTHSLVSLAAALISNSLTEQIQKTIGSLHRQADQLAKLAHTDPLTGLANRRHLFERLESEFSRAQRYRRPFCLLYIDMDGFKAINDQFGHLFGDEILRGSARAMAAVLRATDLLARIGGDEFAVLLPETDLTGSEHVANKLRKALAAYGSQLSPSLPSLTLSIGVGQIGEEDDAIEDILSRADKAQYLAKSSGKALTRTQEDLRAATPIEQA
ncbi:MAG: GGDEF domain-containing protein [Anaerolineales bacterium]